MLIKSNSRWLIWLVMQTPERYVSPHFTEKGLHGNRV